MVPTVVDGPGAVRFHQDRVVSISDQIVIFPRSGVDADVGHANHGEAVPAFAAHRAAGAFFSDGGSSLTAAEIPGEKPVGDDRRALRGDALVIIGECAQAGAVFQARVGDHVHNSGTV